MKLNVERMIGFLMVSGRGRLRGKMRQKSRNNLKVSARKTANWMDALRGMMEHGENDRNPLAF